MIVFKVFGGRGTVGVRGMTVFKVFGGRGTVGVRGMTVLKVFGGRGSVGVRGMTVLDRIEQARHEKTGKHFASVSACHENVFKNV